MNEIIKQIVEAQNKLWSLSHKLNDPEYWINKAKEEAEFVPAEGDRVYVEVKTWRILISVYHKEGIDGSRFWYNGVWYDTPFPKNHSLQSDILKHLK